MFWCFLSIGLAHADEATRTATYTVQKGDNLTTIARVHNTTWNILAKVNNIKNPNLILIGQTLRVTPTTTTSTQVMSDAKVFLWKKPGNANCKECSVVDSVRGLGYPDIVSNVLIAKVKNREFTVIHITNDTRFDAMYFGKRMHKEHVVVHWKKGHVERAREYFVIHDGTRYALIYPLVCRNWAKSTSIAPTHLTVGPPKKTDVPDDRVVGIMPQQSPGPTPGQITESVCATCPDFIILATFEPLTKKESHTTNTWNE